MKAKFKSEYSVLYCEELKEHAIKGGSLEQFATRIGTTRHTLNYWGRIYPEFREAMDEAVILKNAAWNCNLGYVKSFWYRRLPGK